MDGSLQTLLWKRARALSGSLARVDLAVPSGFLDGESPVAIARERQPSARTISNLIRSECHKLGFEDRRELKSWSEAAKDSIQTRPP